MAKIVPMDLVSSMSGKVCQHSDFSFAKRGDTQYTMKSIITASDVNERVAYGNIKKPMPLNRLGVLLGTAGYKDVRHKIGGVRTRGWLVYQRSTDEINANKNLYAK